MRLGRFLLSEISRKHIGINSRNLEKMLDTVKVSNIQDLIYQSINLDKKPFILIY